MTAKHTSKVAGRLDPRSVSIDFSPEVRGAFRDLAAAVHFSEHVSPEMLSTIQEWAGSKKPDVQEVVVSLPLIAQGVFEHIHMTGDKRAEAAWRNIASELLERGFTLATERHRGK